MSTTILITETVMQIVSKPFSLGKTRSNIFRKRQGSK